jgi:amiloride-sensitive sodium channel subunit beta
MPATTEYAFDLIKEINDVNYPDKSIFNQTQMDELPNRDEYYIFWDIWKIFMGKINSGTFSDLERNKLVHSFEDIFLDCIFNGQPCSPSDFTWQWNPFYGNCYVFNSGLNASGDTVSYKKSTLSDIQFGLMLSIYVGYNDKLNRFNTGWNNWFSFTNSYGLNVMIENNTFSRVDNTNSIALNGGTINYIPVKREFSSKLPKPYSDCDIDNSNPGNIDSYYYNLISQSPYQYSQEFCVVQCMQQQAIKLWNCSIPIYLDIYNVSCRNFNESYCAMDLTYDSEFSSIIPDCIPKCPLECNSTEISYMLTSQSVSGVEFIKLIKKNPTFLSDFNSTPLTVESTSNKFIQLYVYYDSLKYASSTDSPSMDIVMLLGNIGGTLGLFLGVSLLSICEFVHVVIESCFIVKHRFVIIKQITTI